MAVSVGRPEKYTTHVQPFIAEIAQWRKDGMLISAICKQLGISHESLCKYQREYIELSDALTTAQRELHEHMVIRAEDSLYKLTEDREVTEVTIEKGIGKDGPYEKTIERTRFIPANTTAVIFTLKNRDPDNWKDRSELGVSGSLNIIPQALAPVRSDDIIDGEVVDDLPELESPDEAD